MREDLSPLQAARERLKSGAVSVGELVDKARSHANRNAGRNVYLAMDDGLIAEQVGALERLSATEREALPLFGLPMSIKDCFDVRGYVTSCGSKFYQSANAVCGEDSWMAGQLRRAGAVIVGKTHLHQLAYGITGENADFGDCAQPEDLGRLTGGSSSGAVASVQEGSAIAAIGTDTGGSVRVPAALCGLAGFRSSVGVGDWRGGVHLAESFDTLGVVFRDLRDGPVLGSALFGIGAVGVGLKPATIAVVGDGFLTDCDDVVLEGYAAQKEELLTAGATLREVGTDWWGDSREIFAAIQAHEASALQREKLAGRAGFEVFEPMIGERLAWGETISEDEVAGLRRRHEAFRGRMDAMLAEHDFLMLPCASMHELRARVDHAKTRPTILRYTTPVSLSGMPAVTLAQRDGAGMQLVAGRGRDAELLGYAAGLASLRQSASV
jgi:aspartyl-tRNA(Asn)/glutamyl-tRNA(Gln) amidotransferase subunit A